MKKFIYLIRHGETNFNTDPVPRVRGRIDVPLNDKGLLHAHQAGEFLKDENIGKKYIIQKFQEQNKQQKQWLKNIQQKWN